MESQTQITFKDEPIPLVSLDTKANKFTINDEAIDFLNSITGKVGIISVAGMYRTGKSYLLNRMLLGRSSGFGIGPTINPCTKGLWIWGRPLLGQTIDGETINVLVIDSEGIGALDEDDTHDSRIFSLTILLSSCFLYNSVGSIDENAIQNLSLVVNLTKNIHIKSSNSSEDIDNDDYATYFPSFIWVVRDFTLELVDSEGDPITSKEYLERSLTIQKGFSDGIEQKNRIRRLLTMFFKDRECFTLVRPLTNEENLQNLENMDLKALRPEFYEQILNLRGHVLNRIKPKILNGKILNGQMLCGLLKSYIIAINNGAIPNIENAWTYVCRNECMKGINDSIEIYDNIMKDILYNKLPLSIEELKKYHIMGKNKALEVYTKTAIGDICQEYLKDLKKKIKNKFYNIQIENEKEANRAYNEFIIKEYTGIERQLKSNEYKNYNDFERELRLFYDYFIENAPNGPNKKLIILEFMQKSLNDGAIYFIKNIQQEIELQRGIGSDIQTKLEREISELKKDNVKEKNFLMQKISQLEMEKSEIEVKEQNLKENMMQLKSQTTKFESELRAELIHEKEVSQRVIEDLRMKLAKSEEAFKEFERKTFISDSDHQKEKALFSQKVQYYEKMVEELTKREKELTVEVKNAKKDHLAQNKEMTNKYEGTNKLLQTRVDELTERILELENELANRDQKFELEKKKWESNDNKFSSTLDDAQLIIKNLQRELIEAKENSEKRIDQVKTESEKALNEFMEKITFYESSIKHKDEILKSTKNAIEKEKAIMLQKIEFLELQVTEARNQHFEIKKAYDATLKVLDGTMESQSGRVDNNKQMIEMRENHKREIHQLQTEFENIRKKLNFQIEQLTEKNNELELKSKFDANDLQKEIQNLKDQIELLENQKQKLIIQNKNLEAQKLKLLKESEERFKNRIKTLELQLEEQINKTTREIRDIQVKSEESLSQLKNFYEIEKERLEKRIIEEKDKYEKKLGNITEEFEIKLKEEVQLREEEIETLKDELRDIEVNNQGLMQQYEHTLLLKQQTIDTLEKYIKDTKENLASIQTSNAASLEQHLNNFCNERTALINKIEDLNTQLTQKDKELFGLSQAKELLEVNIVKKEATMERQKKELIDEKNALNEKLEEVRTRYQKLNDEYLEKKVEYGRELALSQQRSEFLNKKIEELQRQLDEIIKRYEEKLKIQKQEYNQELNEKLEKSHEEKIQIESKYEKSRKALKEIEATYNKQLSQLETEKAIAIDKLHSLENKKSENEKKLMSDVQAFTLQIAQLKDNYNAERRQLINEIEKYKNQYLQLEQEHSEVVSNYERDKALWKGKFHFLEQQKEQAKNDLLDAQKKFELTLQHLQKHRHADKEESESSQNALISSIEKRYQSQIQDLMDQRQHLIQDYDDKIKKLEKELKAANDKMLIDSYGKIGSQSYIERKMAEMVENEKRLLAELDNVRQDRDSKILEYQHILDIERDALKKKVLETEQKYKDLETKRSALIFEHEKEKARWNLERDMLLNQKNELLDHIKKLEKKKEELLRENEKLKNESRSTRRSINLSGPGPSPSPSIIPTNTNVNMQLTTTTANASNNNNLLLNTKGNMNHHHHPINKLRTSSPGGTYLKLGLSSNEKNLNDITNFNSGMKSLEGYRGIFKSGMSTSANSEDDYLNQLTRELYNHSSLNMIMT